MGYQEKTSKCVLEGKIQLDLSKEYGLVLEGGGARGSFQIGAWKALKESGVKIKGVSGVSVGALNGAMICMDDLEKAERIWEDIEFSTVMKVDEDIKSTLKRVVIEKGFDITPLKKLLRETVNEETIRQSHCELYATTYSLTDKMLLHVDVKALPEGEIEDILLASSYLPVFKSEKLGGKWYTDGGGFNNVPLDVLAKKLKLKDRWDYRDLYVALLEDLAQKNRVLRYHVYTVDELVKEIFK